MAFGQSAGPPASARDVARLAELLAEAGFDSFKEARHPMGLNQRQAGGRFTRDEAAELLERLEAEAEARAAGGDAGEPGGERGGAGAAGPSGERAGASAASSRRSTPPRRASTRRADPKLVLAEQPDESLVAELELRGWTCIPPVSTLE